jgi:kinesin family protein 20
VHIAHAHTLSPPTPPTFTHIFNQFTPQYSFFKRSALPLVKHLLQGQNGLLFAYGVTNSGKTHSIQGGKTSCEAGILPRTLEAVFRSIEGLTSTKHLKPLVLSGVEVLEGDEHGNAEGLAESERNAAEYWPTKAVM